MGRGSMLGFFVPCCVTTNDEPPECTANSQQMKRREYAKIRKQASVASFEKKETQREYKKQLSKETKEEVESKKSLWGPTRNVSAAAVKFKMIGEKARARQRKALESNEHHPPYEYDLDGCFADGVEHVSEFPGLPQSHSPDLWYRQWILYSEGE